MLYELNVHGSVADSFDQARKALKGDPRQAAKVELFDGEKLLSATQVKPGSYEVCAYNGELGSLIVQGAPGTPKRQYLLV